MCCCCMYGGGGPPICICGGICGGGGSPLGPPPGSGAPPCGADAGRPAGAWGGLKGSCSEYTLLSGSLQAFRGGQGGRRWWAARRSDECQLAMKPPSRAWPSQQATQQRQHRSATGPGKGGGAPVGEEPLRVLLHLVGGDLEGNHLLHKVRWRKASCSAGIDRFACNPQTRNMAIDPSATVHARRNL